PWDDFNQKNNVWDIVGDEFTIVSNLKDRYVIKRHNATSPHSGYIYKDNDVMYLFSTGTIYEAEKTYDAWGAHVRKNFQGDFSEAAKKAYRDGYGSRIVEVDEPIFDKPDIQKDKLKFPIDVFPEQIQAFILEANETLNVSIEYMGCSLLWAISVSIGNSINVEVIPGWHENSTVWMALVGQPGWGKTPSIKRMISPLLKLNSREVKRYYKDLEGNEAYSCLTKNEKEETPEIQK